jgi:hypothetical protein
MSTVHRLKLDARVPGYVLCVLGCPYEGSVHMSCVLWMELLKFGCHEASLGDSHGSRHTRSLTPRRSTPVDLGGLLTPARSYFPSLSASPNHGLPARGMRMPGSNANISNVQPTLGVPDE